MEEVDMSKKPSLEMARTTQAYWDGYAAKYSTIELTNYQSGHTSFVMVGADRPGIKILEVGCGSGTGSELIATSALYKKDGDRPGSVLVITDFSSDMISRTKKRFEESDYSYGKGNKVFIDETNYTSQSPPEQIDIDKKIEE